MLCKCHWIALYTDHFTAFCLGGPFFPGHGVDWIGLSSVLRPRQHSIGYMGGSFYRSKDPTNSIKVLKERTVHRQIKHTISRHEHKTQQVP